MQGPVDDYRYSIEVFNRQPDGSLVSMHYFIEDFADVIDDTYPLPFELFPACTTVSRDEDGRYIFAYLPERQVR